MKLDILRTLNAERDARRAVVVVTDTESGAQRLLMDPIAMSIDIPAYAWARDGRSIVISEGGGIRRVALGERHHLLSGTPGDAWRGHNCQGRRLLARAVRCLEHGLREEGYKTVTPTLRGRLDLDCVLDSLPSDDQVGTRIVRAAPHMPACPFEEGSHAGFGELSPVRRFGRGRDVLVLHGSRLSWP